MGPGDRHDDEPLDEGHDEGHEDEHAPRGAPPDPLDRVWLHPTELPLTATPSAPSARAARARSGPGRWLVPILAGAAGALVTVAILALTGVFNDSRTADPVAAQNPGPAVTTDASTATARLGASVVAVAARDANGWREGSGVCVRHGGEVLTSARVVGDATSVDVVTADGARHRATVKGRDPVTDLALLSLQDTDLPAAELADHAPGTGASVWVLGAAPPGSKSSWVSSGMIASTDSLVVTPDGPNVGGLLETDAASGAGSAGGALVDDSGNLTGIVLSAVPPGTTTYAVPITTAVAVAEELHDSGVAKHGSLQIEASDTAYGPVVKTMLAGGSAAHAGMHAGDIVQTFDGRVVESAADLHALVSAVDPGQTIVVDVLRGSTTTRLRVTLGAA